MVSNYIYKLYNEAKVKKLTYFALGKAGFNAAANKTSTILGVKLIGNAY